MVGKIIYGLKLLWRNTILKGYRKRKADKIDKYWEEHRICNGKENKDKTFYVIRRRDLYCGLFSVFITSLQRIDDAVKKGWIPIVDMQNDFNIYLSEDKIGKENAWEYYFKQPMGYSLNDIKKSKNVIIGSGAVPEMFPYLDINFLNGTSKEIDYWRKCVKKYISINETAAKRIDEEYSRLFKAGDKVLGVKFRGTDYAEEKPRNHPIQPTLEQMFSKACEIMETYNCTKVFLATEDNRCYELFLERFGDRMITNKTSFVQYNGGSMGKVEYQNSCNHNGEYESGMEYLITTILLARCDCLCAGCVSATVGALLLTEGYEYTYLFDLGIY